MSFHKHYSIVVYIPETHLEPVKRAMFAAGAGKVGNYQECCWQVAGEGQFRPIVGSKAFIGKVDELCKVQEFRVEMLCAENVINAVILALKESHPYETPAFHFVEVLTNETY